MDSGGHKYTYMGIAKIYLNFLTLTRLKREEKKKHIILLKKTSASLKNKNSNLHINFTHAYIQYLYVYIHSYHITVHKRLKQTLTKAYESITHVLLLEYVRKYTRKYMCLRKCMYVCVKKSEVQTRVNILRMPGILSN